MRTRNNLPWILIWLLTTGLVAATWSGVDPTPTRILVQTVSLALLAFLIATPLALWCALRWTRGPWWERGAVTSIVALALVPLCLQVAAWESVLGRWRTSLVPLGSISAVLTANWAMAIWIHAASGVAWLTILFAVGFWTRGWVLEQQALLDAHPLRVFFRVTLIGLRPMLVAGALWMLVLVAREIAVSDIYQIGTYAEHVYLGYALRGTPGSLQIPEDQSIVQYFGPLRQIALLLFLVVSTLLAFRLTFVSPDEESTRPPIRMPHQGFAFSVVTIGVWASLFAIPISGLAIRGGTYNRAAEGRFDPTFSWSHLIDSIAQSAVDYRWNSFWTVSIGLATALIATSLATVLAWQAVRRKTFAAWVFFPLVAASLSIPYPLVGVSVDSMFSSIELVLVRQLWDRSILGPVVAITAIAFGPISLTLYFAMRQSAQTMLESMTTERAGALALFWKLGVGSNRKAIGAMAVVAFLIAVGDVATSFQVLPPGIDTVARSILGQLHSGVDDRTAAICLTSLFGTICLSTVALLAYLRRETTLTT